MDSITRKKLKALMEGQHWEAIYTFLSIMNVKWNDTPIKADDQFNTTWNMAVKEGKIIGMKEFFDTLENEIFKEL